MTGRDARTSTIDQAAWTFIGAVLAAIDTVDEHDSATELGEVVARIERARRGHLPHWAQRDPRPAA